MIMHKLRQLLLLAALALCCGCARHTRQLVGISCGFSSSRVNTVSANYVSAIRMAGALPVLIPNVGDSLDAARYISMVDALVLSGGEDVSPEYYGEEPLNETVRINAPRDTSDMLLAREALRQKKPVLGICRGAQLLNVVLGGSLYQDIPSQIGEETVHAAGATHNIAVARGSILHKLFGEDSLAVNSYHHQAVKDPGAGVRVTARAPDGVVEAWEAPGIIAVQFHPEKMLDSGDTRWLELFKYFLN